MVTNFSKKENSRGLMFQAGGIVILIVIAAFAVKDFAIYQKKKELTRQIQDYEERIEALKKSNQTLKDEIANADSVDYLEKLAYEQLGQQKPGEKQVIFVKPDEKAKEAPKAQNLFVSFWNWLKSKF